MNKPTVVMLSSRQRKPKQHQLAARADGRRVELTATSVERRHEKAQADVDAAAAQLAAAGITGE